MGTLLYFPIWWYVKNLSFWSKFISRTLRLLIDALGFKPILRHFFAAYRGDRTMVGYGIGMIIRTLWLLAAIPITMGVFSILLVAFLIYLVWPFTLFVSLEAVGERDYFLVGIYLLFFVLCVLLYWRNYVEQPRMTISQLLGKGTREANTKAGPLQLQRPGLCIEKVMTPQARQLWRRFREKHFKPDLTIGDIQELVEALWATRRVQKVLQRLDLSNERRTGFLSKLERLRMVHSHWNLSDLASFILQIGQKFSHQYVDGDLIFLGLVESLPQLQDSLKEEKITVGAILETIDWVEQDEIRRQAYKFWEEQFFRLHGGGMGGWVAGFVPVLKRFSTDITSLIKQGNIPRMVGREKEIDEIVRILGRTTQNNVLLLGPAGVGKTSIVYAIAQRILSGELTGKLVEKKVLSLNVASMLAGAMLTGELEARISEALKELKRSSVILFVDEVDQLLQRGAVYFMPVLSEGRIQLIGATTPEDYKRSIEPNSAFSSYFQIVKVEQPTREETIEILEAVAEGIEEDQKVVISIAAIEASVDLTARYQTDRVLPDKALDLLDETAVWARKKSNIKTQNAKVTVTAEDIATVLSEKIGIPLTELTMEESEKLLQLEEILHQRIVDQEEAISAVANAMRRARAGFSSKKRPIASFLFVGPTGVGKTETAKALAESYFGKEEKMIRMDMSEFSEHGSVVSFADRLCDRVREIPFSVLLLDEIEKAESDIHDLFLQVVDEGWLTDSEDKKADFSNVLIIGTSNAFSEFIIEALQRRTPLKEINDVLLNNLQKIFRPELLNRFDGVIVFKPLTLKEVRKITGLLLNEVKEELSKKEIQIEFSDRVVEELAHLGYNRAFGARPLRRVIQEKVEDPLAKMILQGRVRTGKKVEVAQLPII